MSEHPYEMFIPDYDPVIREEYANGGVLRWLFSRRRQILLNKVIIFSPVNLATKGMAILDPVHNIWQRPIEFLRKRPSPHFMGDEDHWLCEQYREIPSRWTSMKKHISWFFQRIFRGYIFMSDDKVVVDMRRRGEL